MADSQEPSYYEIALTNRQVLVAFVILLTCVLVAFFAGVWVGRGSPASAAEARQTQMAQPTPSTEPPQELSFFNDQEKGAPRPDLQGMAKSPRQGTTLAQDLGVEKASPTPAPPAPSEAPAPAPSVAATSAAAGVPTASRPGTAPTTAPVAHPAAGDDEDTRAAAAPAGSLFIQVFSSKDEIQARRLAKKIRGTGLPAFLSPAAGKFRVRIGPYQDRNAAQTAANRVRRDFRVDTWITATP